MYSADTRHFLFHQHRFVIDKIKASPYLTEIGFNIYLGNTTFTVAVRKHLQFRYFHFSVLNASPPREQPFTVAVT